jgi:hypothetical protein
VHALLHVVMSSLVHGVVYALIFKFVRTLTWPQALFFGAAVLGLAALLYAGFSGRSRR